MLFLFATGDELMEAVKNDTQQDIGRRRNKEKVYPIYDADCTVLNSIQYSNKKRVQGTLGITMQASNTFPCVLSPDCVRLLWPRISQPIVSAIDGCRG